MQLGNDDFAVVVISISNLKANIKFNDTHMEKRVLYWIRYKNLLKCKVGCFWRFSYVYTIN